MVNYQLILIILYSELIKLRNIIKSEFYSIINYT